MTDFSNLPATALRQAVSLAAASGLGGDEQHALAWRRFAIQKFNRVGCDERRRAKNNVDFLRNEPNG